MTTKAMIQDVKDMGFQTIRIPVTWSIHCDANGVVDPSWMARVKEVVGYAYDLGMYVILNSHHDNRYYDLGGCAKSAQLREENIGRMQFLWRQIAEAFQEYDERLIFETLNEPRNEGSLWEWIGGTKAERRVLFQLNREIVDTIRAAGGSNRTRYIMIPGYAALSSKRILEEMDIPEDDRVIISVHAYSPQEFAFSGTGSGVFDDRDRRELDQLFALLNDTFIQRGIPVIIGEFGAVNKANPEDRCAWADCYVRGAKQYGIACVVWDNNAGEGTGSEKFGLYNRSERSWYYPELAKAYVGAAGN